MSISCMIGAGVPLKEVEDGCMFLWSGPTAACKSKLLLNFQHVWICNHHPVRQRACAEAFSFSMCRRLCCFNVMLGYVGICWDLISYVKPLQSMESEKERCIRCKDLKVEPDYMYTKSSQTYTSTRASPYTSVYRAYTEKRTTPYTSVYRAYTKPEKLRIPSCM